jgi:hypothetical protein
MSPFKENLKRIPPHITGLVVRVHEIGKDRGNTSWLGIRFFRRSSGIQYKGIVHNKASFIGGCAATDVEMNHYGYSLDPEKMEQKRSRTEKLLQKRLDNDPEDHAALYYMCQLRVGQKRYSEAEDYGLRFFKCVPVGPTDFQFYSVMYFFMSWIALHKEDGNKTVDWALKGLEFFPDDIDLNYIMARVGYQARRDDWLEQYGNKYMELYDSKIKGQSDNGEFQQELDPSYWQNRTIYTFDEAARESVNTFMEAIGG